MEEAAQWKGHAKLGLELRGIFGRSLVQETITGSHGRRANALVLGFITDILAGHGAYDRTTNGIEWVSDQIRGWTALCALGGNVGVTFKQMTSIPAFGFEIGLLKTAKYVGGWAASRNDMVPMESFVKRRVGDSARVMEAVFDEERTTDELIDAIADLAAGLNQIARDAKRVLENSDKPETPGVYR